MTNTSSPSAETDKDIAFLREAASFFEHADAMGEDRAFWANTYNAEACRRIADRLAALPAPTQIKAGGADVVVPYRLASNLYRFLNELSVSAITLKGMQGDITGNAHLYAVALKEAFDTSPTLSPKPGEPYASDPICVRCASQEHGSPSLPKDCTCGDYKPGETIGEALDAAEARIMQEYRWGNLTALGVANHLRRAGFRIEVAQEKANALTPSPISGEVATRPLAWWHEILEPDRIEANVLLSRSPDNPWSHWLQSHRDDCAYRCIPLYATQPTQPEGDGR